MPERKDANLRCGRVGEWVVWDTFPAIVRDIRRVLERVEGFDPAEEFKRRAEELLGDDKGRWSLTYAGWALEGAPKGY